jgi:hypothetical protein
MINLNTNSLSIISKLKEAYPDQVEFRKGVIEQTAISIGLGGKDWGPICCSELRVRKGTYNLSTLISTSDDDNRTSEVKVQQSSSESKPTNQFNMVTSVSSNSVNISEVDPTYVPFGAFKDIVAINKSNMFFPTFIAGLSGNGKTFMVEQACAKTKTECLRVQINPETDEDDLIGGFRLINGETVFAKGPVIKAMESGSTLLLDEIDRATNKIMCLQGILEGKPVLIKKTGELIHPAPGFNVIATANTKGKGSEDGRFSAATIIDDAFLERFAITIDQEYPSKSVETKILNKHADKFGLNDPEFIQKLVVWSEIIRKTFEDDGVDEVISTRRLCHIIKTHAIFGDRLKSINLCISRFDDDTREAFIDLYTKLDIDVSTDESNDTPTSLSRNVFKPDSAIF